MNAPPLCSNFGSDWAQIVADWYFGRVPPVSADDGCAALRALERLWPERLAQVTSRRDRGLLIMAPLIDLGLVLLKCEGRPGFDRVMARMKGGERAAIAEARTVAELARLGYAPSFEPKVSGGKVVDAEVEVDGTKVYIEVASPDQSEVLKEANQQALRISIDLTDELPAYTYDVCLLDDPAKIRARDIADLVRSVEPPPEGTTVEVPNIALVRVSPLGTILKPVQECFPSWNPAELPVLILQSGGVGAKPAAAILVNVLIPDDRAKRFLTDEAEHFSKADFNLLILNVSDIAGRRKHWPNLIRRQFQPARYTRIGAVGLFSCGTEIEEASVICNWTVLPNPHAVKPLPPTLLEDLRLLEANSRHVY